MHNPNQSPLFKFSPLKIFEIFFNISLHSLLFQNILKNFNPPLGRFLGQSPLKYSTRSGPSGWHRYFTYKELYNSREYNVFISDSNTSYYYADTDTYFIGVHHSIRIILEKTHLEIPLSLRFSHLRLCIYMVILKAYFFLSVQFRLGLTFILW